MDTTGDYQITSLRAPLVGGTPSPLTSTAQRKHAIVRFPRIHSSHIRETEMPLPNGGIKTPRARRALPW